MNSNDVQNRINYYTTLMTFNYMIYCGFIECLKSTNGNKNQVRQCTNLKNQKFDELDYSQSGYKLNLNDLDKVSKDKLDEFLAIASLFLDSYRNISICAFDEKKPMDFCNKTFSDSSMIRFEKIIK